ncbi:MAG: hypothetical protein R3A52_21250 [Polyangiales bacterium]
MTLTAMVVMMSLLLRAEVVESKYGTGHSRQIELAAGLPTSQSLQAIGFISLWLINSRGLVTVGTFGSEFVNAGEFLLARNTIRAPFDAPQNNNDPRWVDYTRDLNRVIDGDSGLGVRSLRDLGGYLYFPPGRYFLTMGITISPKMTVIFAPGAVLEMPTLDVPGSDARFRDRFSDFSVHIQGGIQAGLHQIVNSTVKNGLPTNRGSLIFETDTVKEAYPEWWGAESMDVRNPTNSMRPVPPDSSDAIQSALDAAINDIRPGGRASANAIPVVLTGSYFVARPLFIGRRPWSTTSPGSEDSPFVLRGNVGAAAPESGTSSLQAHPAFPLSRVSEELGRSPTTQRLTSNDHLLVVRGPPGFLIENLQFDASDNNKIQRAFGCLHLEKGGGNADAQMSRVRRCVFRMALVNLVQVGEFEHPYRPTSGAAGTGGQDLLGLVFESCKFEQDSAPPSGAALADWTNRARDSDWLRDGVYFRANETLRLHFIDCFWRGMMRAGIRAYSGTVTLTNCNLHITRMPVPSTVCVSQDGRYGTYEDHSNGPHPDNVFIDARDNGCDIYVERFPGEATTGVSVFGLESQSQRFLSSYPAVGAVLMDGGRPSYDVYIEDAHLDNATGKEGDIPLNSADASKFICDPPAVEWLAPFFRGGSITFSGLLTNNKAQRRGFQHQDDNESLPITNKFYRTPFTGRVVVGANYFDTARLINLGARTSYGFSVEDGTPGPAHVYFFLGVSMEGPSPVTRDRPWFLNLNQSPISTMG